jgi:hypothetical protein
MAAPLNQPPAPKQTNYLPWVLGGCAVALVLGIIVVGVAGVIFYAMTPANKNGRGGGLGGSGLGGVQTVDRHGLETVAKNWSSCTRSRRLIGPSLAMNSELELALTWPRRIKA